MFIFPKILEPFERYKITCGRGEAFGGVGDFGVTGLAVIGAGLAVGTFCCWAANGLKSLEKSFSAV